MQREHMAFWYLARSNTSQECFIVKYHNNICSHFYHICWIHLCYLCAVLMDEYNNFIHWKLPNLYHVDCNSTSRATVWLLRAPQCVSHCDITGAIIAALWCHREQKHTQQCSIGWEIQFKLLLYINQWMAHIQSKQFTACSLNHRFEQGHAW